MSYIVPLIKAIYLLIVLAATVWVGFIFGFYGVFFSALFESGGDFFLALMLLVLAAAPAVIVIFTHSKCSAFLDWVAPRWSEWLPFYETMQVRAQRSPRVRRLLPGWGSCCEGVKATLIMTFANWTTAFIWLPLIAVESQVQESLYYRSSYAAQQLIEERSSAIAGGIMLTWIFIAFCLYRIDYQCHQWAIARKQKVQRRSPSAPQPAPRPTDPIETELGKMRHRVRRESGEMSATNKPKPAKPGRKRRPITNSSKQQRPDSARRKAGDKSGDDFDSIFK